MYDFTDTPPFRAPPLPTSSTARSPGFPGRQEYQYQHDDVELDRIMRRQAEGRIIRDEQIAGLRKRKTEDELSILDIFSGIESEHIRKKHSAYPSEGIFQPGQDSEPLVYIKDEDYTRTIEINPRTKDTSHDEELPIEDKQSSEPIRRSVRSLGAFIINDVLLQAENNDEAGTDRDS